MRDFWRRGVLVDISFEPHNLYVNIGDEDDDTAEQFVCEYCNIIYAVYLPCTLCDRKVTIKVS